MTDLWTAWLRQLRISGAALALAALAACGGGGGGGGPSRSGAAADPVGSSGVYIGTVTGLGSVIVEGHSFEGAPPHYFNDDDPGAAQPASAVGLGQRLQMITDAAGGAALVEPAVVGPVQAVSMADGSLVVNGLRIRVNADPRRAPPTFYSGLAGLAGLHPGSTVVRVDGAFGLDSAGQPYLLASRVVQLPPATTQARLTGLVSRLDAGGGTLRLGNVAVRLDAATQVYPAGSTLRDGELVNVWSPRRIHDGVLAAAVVRVRSLLGASGQARIGGLATVGAGGALQVAGITIAPADTTAAGEIAAIRNGQYVRVRGRVAAGGSRVLASSVLRDAGQEPQVRLRGNVTSYVDNGHFLVRGVAVDASAALAGARLGNGAFVQVLGRVDPAAPDRVLASRVRHLAMAPRGGTVDLRGTVSQYDPTRGSLVLSWSDAGVTEASLVNLAPNAVFDRLRTSALRDGSTVRIEAVQQADSLLAYSVSPWRVAPAGATPALRSTRGRVYRVGPQAFEVNGLRILRGGVAPHGGALVDGARVRVRFAQAGVGGALLARAIRVEP